jgi:hypothetical protein
MVSFTLCVCACLPATDEGTGRCISTAVICSGALSDALQLAYDAPTITMQSVTA